MSTKPHIPFKPVAEGYLGSHPKMRWNRVLEALEALYEVFYAVYDHSDDEVVKALIALMEAYDEWLD